MEFRAVEAAALHACICHYFLAHRSDYSYGSESGKSSDGIAQPESIECPCLGHLIAHEIELSLQLQA